GLRTVLRYYDAAEVAWGAEEAEHEREQRPRHLPASEGDTVPYFADSEPAATIEEFPFLGSTVAREPHPALLGGESSGLWRAGQARSLLWERARGELACAEQRPARRDPSGSRRDRPREPDDDHEPRLDRPGLPGLRAPRQPRRRLGRGRTLAGHGGAGPLPERGRGGGRGGGSVDAR